MRYTNKMKYIKLIAILFSTLIIFFGCTASDEIKTNQESSSQPANVNEVEKITDYKKEDTLKEDSKEIENTDNASADNTIEINETVKSEKKADNISISQASNSSKAENESDFKNNNGKDEIVLEKKSSTATISIIGCSETGIILSNKVVNLEDEETVLEALKKVAKENKIQLGIRGNGVYGYVEAINNLYEFDKGPGSGWMYSVNDVFLDKSAGSVKIESGDNIKWLYTLDMGKDIGAYKNR